MYSNQEFDTSISVTSTTAKNNWSLDSLSTTSGNIFSGVATDSAQIDSLGITSKKLAISFDGVNFVDVSATGTTSVQGTYGKLSISADGNYTYNQINTGSLQDQFTYKVTSENGEVATAKLTIGYESTIHGTQFADIFISDAIFHVLETAGAADILKITDFNKFEGHTDIWTDFSKSEGDKIDVSLLLSGKGVTASNISDYLSVTIDGSASILKIDLDGKGTQHTSQDLLILQNNQVGFDELLKGDHILY